MPIYLCKTCGIRHPDADTPPECCAICEDPRQFVPAEGQRWVTWEALQAGHANRFKQVASGLIAISTEPQFGIGQRAFLIRTPAGNVLWDCISLLDDATRDIIAGLGGLAAVAISHPHFYSAMAAWGRAFNCPVLIHEADRKWVAEPAQCLDHWSGETQEILPGVTLHRVGGHFPGSTVLQWERRLFTGDAVLVTADRQHVAFMWSYPNYVPLKDENVRRIVERFDALDYDTIHSPFWSRGDIVGGAREAVGRSAARYIEGRGEG